MTEWYRIIAQGDSFVKGYKREAIIRGRRSFLKRSKRRAIIRKEALFKGATIEQVTVSRKRKSVPLIQKHYQSYSIHIYPSGSVSNPGASCFAGQQCVGNAICRYSACVCPPGTNIGADGVCQLPTSDVAPGMFL